MKRGDKVDLTGYDIQARINYASHEDMLIVAHNNSTHVLLFRLPWNEDNQMYDDLNAVFIESWKYTEHDFEDAYRAALIKATGIVVGSESDE